MMHLVHLILLALLALLVLTMIVTWPRKHTPKNVSVNARGDIRITTTAEGTVIETQKGYGYAVIDGKEYNLKPGEKRFIPR